MTESKENWEGILGTGETVLWQGKPEGAVVWRDVSPMQAGAAACLAGLGLFLVAQVGQDQGGAHGVSRLSRIATSPPDLAIALVGIGLVWSGIYHAVGRLLLAALVRRRTRYLLSDKAGYIARGLIWRRRSRYPFGAAEDLLLDEAAPGTVWFAREERWKSRRKEVWTNIGPAGSTRRLVTGLAWERAMIPVGFERIADAGEVYRLIRNSHGTRDTSEARA